MRRTVHQTLSRTALLVCGVSMLLGAACKRTETTGKAAESTPSVVAGKLNVGFVYVSSASDGGWSFAHDQGRKYLEQSLPYVRAKDLIC